jgi:uncharacterized membrane protein
VTHLGSLALQLVPAVLSGLVAARFVQTLRPGRTPQIEAVARLMERDGLPEFAPPWLRQVTRVWAWVLAANAVVLAALALAAPLSWWALYTGVVQYALVGLLLAGEYVIRKARFRWYRDGFLDRIWARWLPSTPAHHGWSASSSEAKKRSIASRRSPSSSARA